MSASPTGTEGAAFPLAIIAGSGEYPPRLASLAAARGHEVFVAAVEGAASIDAFAPDSVRAYRLGQLGRLLAELRRRGIGDLVLIGALPRPSFGSLLPEPSTLKYLPHFARAFQGGDDHLLKGVVQFFEGQGFRVHGSADIAPELTAPLGPLGKRQVPAVARGVIEQGFALLAALSPFDVGQAAIVADHRVVAIEAAEGTDAMIRRVADLVATGRLKFGKGDGILVKAPKDGQDLRVDMPAVGSDTLRNLAQAGLSGVALRAGKVLVGDSERLGRLADELGLFIEGVA